MRLTNTSRYPLGEVEAIVAFGMYGVTTDRLAVRVKNNATGAYRGRAYSSIPLLSAALRLRGCDRLVTIGIGKPSAFPCDNLVTTYKRWPVPIGGEAPAGYDPVRWGWIRDYIRQLGIYRQPIRHSYGGVHSPFIEMHTWQEALVAVAAHEARHIYQFQHDKPRSEVDAERHAAKRLEAWRAKKAGV